MLCWIREHLSLMTSEQEAQLQSEVRSIHAGIVALASVQRASEDVAAQNSLTLNDLVVKTTAVVANTASLRSRVKRLEKWKDGGLVRLAVTAGACAAVATAFYTLH